MSKEQSELSTIGLRRWVKNKVDLVPLACTHEYGTKWTKYHWLAKMSKEQSGLSTIGWRRWVKNKVDLIPLAGEDE